MQKRRHLFCLLQASASRAMGLGSEKNNACTHNSVPASPPAPTQSQPQITMQSITVLDNDVKKQSADCLRPG